MTKTVGKQLMEERRARKVRLQSIADELCISKSYLQALENEDWDNLPPKVFAIGFLRTYSDYLGLDTDDLVHRSRDHAAEPEKTVDVHLPQMIHESRMPAGGVLFAATSALISVVFGWSVLTAQTVAENDDNAVPARFVSNTDEATTEDDETKKPQTSNAGLGGAFPSFDDDKMSSAIEIEARRDAWVRITDDKDRTLRDGVVRTGEVISIPAHSNLRLTASDAGALVLLRAGHDEKPLGEAGDVLTAYAISDLN